MKNYYFEFWTDVQKILSKDFSIFSCVGHLHRTIWRILVEGLMRIICVKSF